MPLYDYDCAACGRRFEVIHGVHADPPASCPLCGSGPVRKAISAPAVHFKGSGWAKKERRAGVKSGAASDSGTEGSESGEVPAAATAGSGDGASDGSKATSDGSKAAPSGSSDASTGSTKPSGSSKTVGSSTD